MKTASASNWNTQPDVPSALRFFSLSYCPDPGPLVRAVIGRWFRILPLVGIVTPFWTRVVCAQGWYTVDDFQYSPGTNAVAMGLAKDLTGTIIYSTGFGQDPAGMGHALAFKSNNGGTNWALIDDYTGTASPYGDEYRGIATDSAGNIYTIGYDLINSGAVQTWFTRRSVDGGSTWSTVDTVSEMELARPKTLSVDLAGNVYVAGQIETNATSYAGSLWIVRKGISGSSWTTVAQSGPQTNLPAWSANGVFCHPNAGVFIVGVSPGPPVSVHGVTTIQALWTVRRSQDGGATWATVDTYESDPAYGSVAYGGGVDGTGNIYVVGSVSTHQPNSPKAVSTSYWTVRKSSNGGNTWSTMDDYLPAISNYSTPDASASAVGFDANGNVFVAGNDNQGPGGSSRWIVRRSPDGGATWATLDSFQYAPGKAALPLAVLGDNKDDVYIAGYGSDGAGVNHWLVRKY